MLTIKTYTVITDDGIQRIHEERRDVLIAGIRIFRRITETRRTGSDVPADVRRVVFAMDNNECVYCQAPGEAIDHIIPQVQQGTSSIFNLATACRSCNSRKGGRTPIEAGMLLRFGRFVIGPNGVRNAVGFLPNIPGMPVVTLPASYEWFVKADDLDFTLSPYADSSDVAVRCRWIEHIEDFKYGEPFNSAFIACQGRIPFLYS